MAYLEAFNFLFGIAVFAAVGWHLDTLWKGGDKEAVILLIMMALLFDAAYSWA